MQIGKKKQPLYQSDCSGRRDGIRPRVADETVKLKYTQHERVRVEQYFAERTLSVSWLSL
jgi:hypothetical protein